MFPIQPVHLGIMSTLSGFQPTTSVRYTNLTGGGQTTTLITTSTVRVETTRRLSLHIRRTVRAIGLGSLVGILSSTQYGKPQDPRMRLTLGPVWISSGCIAVAVAGAAVAVGVYRHGHSGPTTVDSRSSPTVMARRTGVLVVDQTIDVLLKRSPFQPSIFFEPTQRPCVASSDGAPAPSSGPHCEPGQNAGEMTPSVEVGLCALTWYPPKDLSFETTTLGQRALELYAVLPVQNSSDGLSGYVLYFAAGDSFASRTLIVTTGMAGVKRVSGACGQGPPQAVPSGLAPEQWLIAPPG